MPRKRKIILVSDLHAGHTFDPDVESDRQTDRWLRKEFLRMFPIPKKKPRHKKATKCGCGRGGLYLSPEDDEPRCSVAKLAPKDLPPPRCHFCGNPMPVVHTKIKISVQVVGEKLTEIDFHEDGCALCAQALAEILKATRTPEHKALIKAIKATAKDILANPE